MSLSLHPIAKQKLERRALMLGMTAIVMWSTVATAFKLALDVVTTNQLLLLGTGCSWIIFAIARSVRRQFHLPQRFWSSVALLGVLNPLCYYAILFVAYDRLPAHIAQPLNYTWAITLAILAIPILGQRLSMQTLCGILISYGGVLVLLGGHVGITSFDGLGIGLAMGSTLIWASYWLLSTRLSQQAEAPEATLVMFWSFTFALPLVTALCLATDGLPALNLQTIGYGIWVGAFEMGLSFICWQSALRLTDNVSRMGQLIFLSPFLSLVLIYLILGESFGSNVFIGLAVIVAGLAVTQRETVNP